MIDYVLTLIMSISIIFLAYAIHKKNSKELPNGLYLLNERDFDLDQLYRLYCQPQGANFDALTNVAWSLFFLCLAFLFFLTPTPLGPSLMWFPELASNKLGFWIFALVIVIITFSLSCSIRKVYSFYNLSRQWKMIISYGVPFILFLPSLSFSIYLGIIYPGNDDKLWLISYILMFLGEVILLLPVFLELDGRA